MYTATIVSCKCPFTILLLIFFCDSLDLKALLKSVWLNFQIFEDFLCLLMISTLIQLLEDLIHFKFIKTFWGPMGIQSTWLFQVILKRICIYCGLLECFISVNWIKLVDSFSQVWYIITDLCLLVLSMTSEWSIDLSNLWF